MVWGDPTPYEKTLTDKGSYPLHCPAPEWQEGPILCLIKTIMTTMRRKRPVNTPIYAVCSGPIGSSQSRKCNKRVHFCNSPAPPPFPLCLKTTHMPRGVCIKITQLTLPCSIPVLSSTSEYSATRSEYSATA